LASFMGTPEGPRTGQRKADFQTSISRTGTRGEPLKWPTRT
jgi:hypothetical protein